MTKLRHQPREGFTLIEIIVVTAIIAILALLIWPIINMAKNSAKKSELTSRLHKASLAIALYMSGNDDSPPPKLASLGTDRRILICPLSGKEFYYPLNINQLQRYGSLREVVPEFNPSVNAVVKAMHVHDVDCGYRNKNCDVQSWTDRNGVTWSYTIPHTTEYRVLAGFMDGHVKYVPGTEDWERAHFAPLEGSK